MTSNTAPNLPTLNILEKIVWTTPLNDATYFSNTHLQNSQSRRKMRACKKKGSTISVFKIRNMLRLIHEILEFKMKKKKKIRTQKRKKDSILIPSRKWGKWCMKIDVIACLPFTKCGGKTKKKHFFILRSLFSEKCRYSLVLNLV